MFVVRSSVNSMMQVANWGGVLRFRCPLLNCKGNTIKPRVNSYLNLECSSDLKCLKRYATLKEVGADTERKLGTLVIATVWSRGFWICITVALLAGGSSESLSLPFLLESSGPSLPLLPWLLERPILNDPPASAFWERVESP